MIGTVVVIAGTDPGGSDPSSLGARLCESRDGMLSVSLWLLRSRIAQYMATLQEEIRAGKKMRERHICRHSALQNDTF